MKDLVFAAFLQHLLLLNQHKL